MVGDTSLNPRALSKQQQWRSRRRSAVSVPLRTEVAARRSERRLAGFCGSAARTNPRNSGWDYPPRGGDSGWFQIAISSIFLWGRVWGRLRWLNFWLTAVQNCLFKFWLLVTRYTVNFCNRNFNWKTGNNVSFITKCNSWKSSLNDYKNIVQLFATKNEFLDK